MGCAKGTVRAALAFLALFTLPTAVVSSWELRKLQQTGRIVGGEDAPKGRFPYIGSLKNDINQHLCGAVLINERFALTGGHCVHPNYQLSAKLNAHITIGLYDSTDDGDAAGIEVIKIKDTHIHPNFTVTSLKSGGDIALLELLEPSTLTPIPLPDPKHVPDGSLLALGWGSYNPHLQQAFLEIESDDICKKAWGSVGPSVICASSKYADTCRGGPLIIPHAPERKISDGRPKFDTLVALTSFGDPNCTRLEMPGAYTLVAPYMPWIERIIEKQDSATVQPQLSSQDCTGSVAGFRRAVEAPFQYSELLRLKIPSCANLDIRRFEQCDQEFRHTLGCCTKPCGRFLKSIPSVCWKSIVSVFCKSNSQTLLNQLDKVSELCRGLPAKCPANRSRDDPDCEADAIAPRSPLPKNLIPSTLKLIIMKPPRACGKLDMKDFQICGSDLGETQGCCSKSCAKFLTNISDQCLNALETTLCAADSQQILSMLDLLLRRCVPKGRSMNCLQVQEEIPIGHLNKEGKEDCEEDGSCGDVNTELLSAAEKGDLDEVQRAIARGGDIETIDGGNYRRTPLHWAAHEGHLSVVNWLIKTGANLEANSRTGVSPLMYAASSGHLEVVEALLLKGADVNATDRSKWTALMYAARYGHEKVVAALAVKGTDLEAKDTLWNYSALVWAALNDYLVVVKLLISAGANIETRSRRGWTPLMLAASEDKVNLSELLIDKGADTDATTLLDTHLTNVGLISAGSTALHIAAHADHVDVVKVLIKLGANKNLRDSKRKTPGDVVQSWSTNSKVLESLLQ